MSRAQLTSTVEQNTGGAVSPYVAGKNKIINGDFGIWQRGITFSGIGNYVYTADRWCAESNGTSTVTQQAFTAGTAPVAGYEGQYFLRQQVTSASTVQGLNHRVEDIRTLAGQTATISFWAKAASTTSLNFIATQFFVAAQQDNMNTTFSIGTTWKRYSYTGTIGSVAGFTLPNPNYLSLRFLVLTNTTYTLDIWGVQLEAGSVATPFTTATGTLSGELMACQRYYWRSTGVEAYGRFAGMAIAQSTPAVLFAPALPVTMRTYPQSLDYSNIYVYDGVTGIAVSSATIQSGGGSLNSTSLNLAVTGAVQYRPYFVATNNNAAGYIGYSAEL